MVDENQDDRDDRSLLVEKYLYLTRTVMPELARSNDKNWPVRNDHCFQRIVLDAISNGVWYDHIPRPAYQHLSRDQAKRAVDLCEEIIAGNISLVELNHNSLSWRGKR